MANLIELIISAVGADDAAASVQKVAGSVRQMAQTITSEASPAAAGLGDSLGDTSLVMRDKLGGALDDTTKQLLAFGLAAVSVRGIYDGLRDAVGDGAAFVQLSRRTGENVADLVVLRQAFENAGLGINYVATASNLLDRILSGTAANGKRTNEVFQEMGITVEQMRELPFTQQLQLLATGFARLPDQAARAGAAMALFGRYAGGQMLQLLGDADAFSRAQDQAGRLADRMQLDAAAFNEVSMRLSVVKVRIEELFVAAAEQLLPTLQAVAKEASGINLSGLGTVLGDVGPTLIGGLVAAKITDKLDLALLNSAERWGGTMRGELAGVASQFTGVLANVLPVGLGAAVAAQLVIGIFSAMENAKVQALMEHQRAVSSEVNPDIQAAQGVTSQEDASQKAAVIQARIQELQRQKSDLEARAASDQATFDASGGSLGAVASRLDSEQEQIARINEELVQKTALYKGLTDAQEVAAAVARNQLKETKEALEPLVAKLASLRDEHDKLSLDTLAPNQQAMVLQGREASLQRQLAAGPPKGLSGDESEAYTLSIENQLLEVRKQEKDVAEKMTEAANKLSEQEKQQLAAAEKRAVYAMQTQIEVAKAAGDDELAEKLKEQLELKEAIFSMSGLDLQLAKQRIDAEHRIFEQDQAQKEAKANIEAERLSLENTLGAIRKNLSDLEADTDKTESQKWEERKAAIQKEIETLQAAIAEDRLLAAQARAKGNDQVANQYDASANDKSKQLASAQGDAAHLGPNPNDWIAQTQKSLSALQQQMGTVAQQIAHSISSVIGGAFDSVENNLTKVFTGTEKWRQAIGQIGFSIEKSIVGAIVDMGVKWVENLVIMAARWVATQIGMATAGKGVAAANVAALVPIAMATSAVWSAPATLATIATFGGAAAEAPPSIAAAMATSAGLSFAGFSSGGYTGEGGGIVHPREFVFSAPAVKAIGLQNLESAHRAALNPGNTGGFGGGSRASTARERPQNHYWYFDKTAFSSALAGDMEGIAHSVFDKRSRTS
jgi:hypothetical protein